MKLTFRVAVFALFVSGCSAAENTSVLKLDIQSQTSQETKQSPNPNLKFGMPRNRSKTPEKIITRSEYVLSWNPERRVANWAAWKIDLDSFGSADRTNDYSVDSELAEILKGSGIKPVDANEYRYSCFDRGHQVPSADRTVSTESNSATFYMSNMYPQTAFLNRGMWEQLETYSRKVVKTNKVLYVISGGVFDEQTMYIGPKKDIAVPATNYKIIAITDPELMGETKFIFVNMPNVTSDGYRPSQVDERLCADVHSQGNVGGEMESDAWKKYQTSLDQIERESGFDFLTNLTQAQREMLSPF